MAAEDDIHNRFMILRRTLDLPYFTAARQAMLYWAVESVSDLGAMVRGRAFAGSIHRIVGRTCGLAKALAA